VEKYDNYHVPFDEKIDSARESNSGLVKALGNIKFVAFETQILLNKYFCFDVAVTFLFPH